MLVNWRERWWAARRRAAAGLAAAMAGTLAVVPAQAQLYTTAGEVEAVPGVEKLGGKLADGTSYMVRKPSNWNGIVVIDLDGIERGNDGSYRLMLEAGYGTASVHRRRADRDWTLNRGDDVRRPQEALGIFREKFGKPRRVIVFGGSAGGAVALLTAEHHPDTVDGAVAMCPIMLFGHAHYNTIFDFFYTLKALLAPSDGRLLTHALPASNHGPIMKHWLEVLRAAAETPQGRARIALAFALAQYPVYGSKSTIAGVAKPDLGDPDQVMDAMVRLLPEIVERLKLLRVYGEKDFPPGLPIRGTPIPNVVGNDGAVYADYWKNADPMQKRVAEAIYAQAGLDLAGDLKTVDGAPRVKLDRNVLDAQGLVGRGLPTIPVFRMENLGDLTAPPNVAKLYDVLVAANGLSALVRTAYVDNSGHCFFKPQHEFMAVELMRERLETGEWPDTSPAALNARIGNIDRWVLDGKEYVYDRGMSFVERKFGPYTGMWRLREYPDEYGPATFATAKALVSGYAAAAVSAPQRRQLLAHLATAERMSSAGQVAGANGALDQFLAAAKQIPDRVVQTRLLATAHRLRAKD